MLAVALDASERHDYRYVALTHGKDGLKGWKWQSPDQGGLRYIGPERPRQRAEIDKVITDALTAPKGSDGNAASFLPMGSADHFTEITGRRVAYKTEDGGYIDRFGQVMKDVNPDIDLIIKLKPPGG